MTPAGPLATAIRWWRTPSTARDLTALTAVLAVIYLLTADHQPFGSATRYYEAARETAELGEWTVPHLGYAPYLEKPPLVYWLGAAARLLGDSPLCLSLPSALSVLAMVLATYALGRAWRDRAVGLGAAFLLLGSSFTQAMSGVLTTDPLIAGFLSVGWWLWWEWERGGRVRTAWLAGFYLAVALGWLTKGPVALVLPAAGIGCYAVLASGLGGMLRTLWQMRPWLGLGIILAVNLPWTLAVWARDPRLLEFFYWRINVDAFLYGSYNHQGPWWQYLPVLAGILAPFTLVALPVLVWALGSTLGGVRLEQRGWSARPPQDTGRLYLASVVLGPLLFLSLSSAKLGTYLMPVMPPVMLLVAEAITRWQTTPRWITALAALQVVVFVLVLALIAPVLMAIDEAMESGHPLTIAGSQLAEAAQLSVVDWSWIPLITAALAVALLALIGSLVAVVQQRLVLGLIGIGVGFTLVIALLMPRMEAIVPDLDCHRLITVLRQRGGDDPDQRQRVVFETGVVQDYELSLALRRRPFIIGGARELGLGHFVQAHPGPLPMPGPGQPIDHPYSVSGENTDHPWLWSMERFRREWQGPERIWLLCHQDDIERATKGLTALVIDRARHILLLSNRP